MSGFAGRGRRQLATGLVAGWLGLLSLGAVSGIPKKEAPPPPPKEVLVDPNEPQPAPAAPSASAALGAPTAVADPAMVEAGHELFKGFCQKCHGLNMVSPGGAFFDLRHFPPDEKPRFVQSVTHGKRAMPAWGGTLKPDDIEKLWAYVMSGHVSP